ncbi:zinc-dependent peptidase [Xanthomarina sp. F1114]|uniref:zinc-dependent peptidase n=1 Tax=Xanthomarina sp. F1114 TaxID=2996019 RepID=UPI00225E035C|nr:zinc-dependent peptidase [Xanthomarina sp. F1114]MCX7546851.1 zinc-dependent peptidase [Xanthomarina sp. F1114]
MIDLPKLPTEYLFIFGFLLFILSGVIIFALINMIESAFVMIYKKPLYRHSSIWLKKLPKQQKDILEEKFIFYNRLPAKEKKFFENRLSRFITDKEFIGRDGIVVSEEMIVLISATAVMLTFGFRNFYIRSVEVIFIYPSQFYSQTNDAYHKGEYNYRLKALVLSWSHFLEGYDIENDNLNLGIHEFVHAIHLNSMREKHIGAAIFTDTFYELNELLANSKNLRERMISTGYFREYGLTNQFEFVAVIIETFIETPTEFRSQFPEVYAKTKQMLNFNFSGY